MPSPVDLCEACPTCRPRAFEVARSRYLGTGELTIGYVVRVWSCTLCKREWEDATLRLLNAAQERNARRAHAAGNGSGRPDQVYPTRPPHPLSGREHPPRQLGRTA